MSNVYNTAPPTKGKVIMRTSLGDLDIELWPKESPLAVRNFVQLCLEGYYDGTLFHRLIKGFIIQGGDPTGTGSGGSSIYGHPFKDEFHSRLHFQHRGILACANENLPHTNGSQFFITLDKTEGLERKNTIFGKITGDSIYNVLRLAELEVDDNDRPLEPPHILETEVLWNPFEDIVPRSTREDRAAVEAERRSIAEAKQRAAAKAAKAGQKKNLALLSFGEEAEEDEQPAIAARGGGGGGGGPRNKIRSAHDVLEDERLARDEETPLEERLDMRPQPAKARRGDEAVGTARDATRATALADLRAIVHRAAGDGEGADATDRAEASEGLAEKSAHGAAKGHEFASLMHAKALQRRQQRVAEDAATGPRLDSEGDEEAQALNGLLKDSRSERPVEREAEAARRKRREELEAMRTEPGKKTYGKLKTSDEVADADLLKPYQLSREKYKQKKRLLGGREQDTMAKLARFEQALGGPGAGQDAAPTAAKATKALVEEGWELKEKASGLQDKRASGGEAVAAAAAKHGGDGGYAGKVATDIDHRSYMPAAWRTDEYWLEEDDGTSALADLKGHSLQFFKDSKQRAMEKSDDVNDYVVFDPLLEEGKGKFSKLHQKGKKLGTEWGKGKAGGHSRD